MNEIKVSVILPVYNPGNGIHKCIESLCSQTLRDIEIIFIDDLGTDSAMNVIRDAAKKDPRIRILTNSENMGSGPSRNRGIEAAVGEYLSFMDPDDYAAPKFLELLYEEAKISGADIVKGDRVLVRADGTLIPDDRRISLCEHIRTGLASRPLFTLFNYEHWSAIYRREWVLKSGARYGTSRNSQDTLFLLSVTYGTDKIAFNDSALYYYVARNNSRVRDFSYKRLDYELIGLHERLSFIREHEIEEQTAGIYVSGDMYSLLKLHSAAAIRPGLKAAAHAYLSDLRAMVNQLPYAYRIAARDKTLEAFLIFGANLTLEPYEAKWGNVPFEEYLYGVHRIVDFICAHPELGMEYRGFLWKAFDQAILYKGWKSRKQKKKAEALLRREAHRLPDQRVLTDKYFSMGQFVKYGINLFGFRESFLGDTLKTAMRYNRKTGEHIRGMMNRIKGSRIKPTACPKETVMYPFPVTDPKISVILPVFNPGKGIIRCLDTLQHQTMADIELIFVDDAGTDQAMTLVRRAAQRDHRIRILKNTENIGAGPSRNRGIEAAGGEYLAFVDPDDYVAENFLELLYERARITGADIIKGTAVKVLKKGQVKSEQISGMNRCIKSGLFQGGSLCFLFTYEHWTGLFKRDWVLKSGARYGTSGNGEDTTFLLRIAYGIQDVEFADAARYYYVQRAGSADRAFSTDRLTGQLVSFREKLDFVADHFECDDEVLSYLNSIIERQLQIHAACYRKPGLEDAARRYLNAVRESALTMPCVTAPENTNKTVRAFIKYGANVELKSLIIDWQEAEQEDYVDALQRVVDFICAHPEEYEDYEDFVTKACDQAMTFSKAHQNILERRKMRRILDRQKARLI